MSSWVTFATGAAFVTYHNAVCAANGLPRPGNRASDGFLQLDHKWTLAWVDPVPGPTALSPVSALVPDADVATFGLTPTATPNALGHPITFTYLQPIPATWLGQPTTGAF